MPPHGLVDLCEGVGCGLDRERRMVRAGDAVEQVQTSERRAPLPQRSGCETTGVKFEFQLRATLPPLSWCARVRRGTPVQVHHGADVETRPEGFVEAAWDGDFGAFDFDEAESLAGPGARVRDGRLIFTAPFHPLERLFVMRSGDEVLVSNSLVFVLAEARDTLDLSHSNYFFDFVAQVRRGIGPPAAR